MTDLAPVHREKLDVVTVSVAEELTGDGLPGEAGARVHVTTLQELELGPALDPATIPLHLVVAGERVGYQIYLISCLTILSCKTVLRLTTLQYLLMPSKKSRQTCSTNDTKANVDINY